MPLPPPLALENIVAHADPDAMINLRATSKELVEIVTESVKTLLCLDGKLPAPAWDRYEDADGVYFGASDHLYNQVDHDELLYEGIKMMASGIKALPTTTKRLELSKQGITMTLGQSMMLSQTLAWSAVLCRLQQLHWRWATAARATHMFLPYAHQLEHFKLRVWNDLKPEEIWRPSFPTKLTSLVLHGATYRGKSKPLQLNLSALDNLSSLQHLKLKALQLHSLGSISCLTSLTSLHVKTTDTMDATAVAADGTSIFISASMSQLQRLQRLRSLRLQSVPADIRPEAWAVLAKLPELALLEARHVYIGAEPLASLTSLQAESLAVKGLLPATTSAVKAVGITAVKPGSNTSSRDVVQGASGSMCIILPSLRKLAGQVSHPYMVALLLQGHQHLQHLELTMAPCKGPLAGRSSEDWQQAVLSTMPALQRLALSDMLYNADALIVDVAACGVLRHVSISKISEFPRQLDASRSITAAGILALVAAPWLPLAITLQLHYASHELHYSSPHRLALAAAKPLLAAPLLQELTVPVRPVADGELRALAQQLRRPVELLREQMVLGGRRRA